MRRGQAVELRRYTRPRRSDEADQDRHAVSYRSEDESSSSEVRIGGVSVKDAITVAIIVTMFAVSSWLAFGCPLHNPVPVDPDYPPITETVRDAGRG